MAREFFERAGLADRAQFGESDTVAIVDDHDGPFDLVLIDHQKHRYTATPLHRGIREGAR